MARRRRVDLMRRAIQLDEKDLLFYSGEFVPERTPPGHMAEGDGERPNL
jgi:hypothetical protein